MDASFIPVEVVPTQTPFGLDQLRRSYKTPLSAEAALLACPVAGTVDETFSHMFLMPVSTPESAESATHVELVYMGTLREIAGEPWLPDQKHDMSSNPASAVSNTSRGVLITQPQATVQYYSPSRSLTWWSTTEVTTTGFCADPPAEIEVITLQYFNTVFIGLPEVAEVVVATMFDSVLSSSIQSTEIVPGHYWQNTERRSRVLQPAYLFEPATIGACTLSLGSCILTTASGCASVGGSYAGDGSTC